MAMVPKAAAAFAPASVMPTRGGPPTRVASSSPSVLTFAAILESGDQLFGSGGTGNIRSTRFGGLVSKAIEIYENNAKVVTGTSNILGTSVSLVL